MGEENKTRTKILSGINESIDKELNLIYSEMKENSKTILELETRINRWLKEIQFCDLEMYRPLKKRMEEKIKEEKSDLPLR